MKILNNILHSTHYYWIPQCRILTYRNNTVLRRQFSIRLGAKLVYLKHFSNTKNVWENQ